MREAVSEGNGCAWSNTAQQLSSKTIDFRTVFNFR